MFMSTKIEVGTTVGELIEFLQTLPKNHRIVFYDHNGFFREKTYFMQDAVGTWFSSEGPEVDW